MDSYTANQLIRLDESFQHAHSKTYDASFLIHAVLNVIDVLDNTVSKQLLDLLNHLRVELQSLDYYYSESEWSQRIKVLHSEYQDFIKSIGPLAGEKTIRDYSFLWSNEKDRYLLYRETKDVDNLDKYLVYDTHNKEFIPIDDPLVHYEIVYQMRKSGVLERSEI